MKLNPDVAGLVGQLDRLRWLKRDQQVQPTEDEVMMHTMAQQTVPPKSTAGVSEDSRGNGAVPETLVPNSEISIAS